MLAQRLAFVLLVLVLMLAAYLYGRSESPAGVSAENRESVALYAEALEMVDEDYVGQEDIDSEQQTYGAIEGMLETLGDEGHTRFLSPEEIEQSRQGLSSTYVGVGIKLNGKDEEVVVTSPIDESPAEEAGIESGDVLVAVDGESVRGEDIKEIGDKVRGPEGTEVELTMLRDGEERAFNVERAELEVSAATWSLIPGTDVAHLRLASFSENSAEKLAEVTAEARAAGAKRFVLDVRDNSGGLVSEAEGVAAQFLPAGSTIFIRKEADDEQEATYVPDNNEPMDAPLVVLVNEGSASSAEIVAGALRDNERARVVGETTFGTGTVLDEYSLSDGSAILLGIAEWLTPDGNFIRGSGIEPDVEVSLEEGQEPRTPEEIKDLSKEEVFDEDAQLERAFTALQEGE
ncbi:MAG: Carboxyl-terminal protease [uncultured Rubrobacteraceae bacterium]|uniref:Carboxyl-terminal protease n=1 Tax=uncultured Rubrobacteraceae bacterium TaxID=349277 RepID=A0A6J4PVW1_9ACTN|nr:MAG: Carboxyl-terminal protease [uncultured Rubrobacteraceae bacterium]